MRHAASYKRHVGVTRGGGRHVAVMRGRTASRRGRAGAHGSRAQLRFGQELARHSRKQLRADPSLGQASHSCRVCRPRQGGGRSARRAPGRRPISRARAGTPSCRAARRSPCRARPARSFAPALAGLARRAMAGLARRAKTTFAKWSLGSPQFNTWAEKIKAARFASIVARPSIRN